MDERPTAKTFRESTLRAMGRLSELTPKREVPFKDVSNMVLEMEGMTEDQYGIQEGSGRPWTSVWIGWAGTRSLRKEGLLDFERKGQWFLTTEGVAAARALMDCVEPLTVIEEISGTSLHLQGGEDTYPKDIYLRALAIEDSICIGHFSPTQEICSTCPLGATCRDVTHIQLAQVAVMLEAQDKHEAEQVIMDVLPDDLEPVGVVEEIADPELSKLVDILESAEPGSIGSDGEMQFTVQNECVCRVCGEKIPANTVAYWSSLGVRHLGCQGDS